MEVNTKITREQFIKERTMSIWCPSKFGVDSEFNKGNCEGKVTCKQCWRKAVKNIKFKGE